MDNNDQMSAFSRKDKCKMLNPSALSSLLFCLSLALNGYFNDTGCLLFATLVYHYQERETEKVKKRNGENKKGKEVKGNDYLRG